MDLFDSEEKSYLNILNIHGNIQNRKWKLHTHVQTLTSALCTSQHMQTQWRLYSHHSSLVTTQITNSSYLLTYSTSQMAKPLMDIYEGIVKTTVGGALWFLFCYVYLVWGSFYGQNLGLCTCWASTLRLSHTCRSHDIFGQMTKRATNSKGQVNSVCSLVWCREKEQQLSPWHYS